MDSVLTGNSVSFKVLAQQRLTTTAVEALSAELGIVGADPLANFESLDRLSDGSNDTDGLMAYQRLDQGVSELESNSMAHTGNKRELELEISIHLRIKDLQKAIRKIG